MFALNQDDFERVSQYKFISPEIIANANQKKLNKQEILVVFFVVNVFFFSPILTEYQLFPMWVVCVFTSVCFLNIFAFFYALFKFHSLKKLITKTKQMPQTEEYIFFRNRMNTEKMDEMFLYMVNTMFPAKDIVINLNDPDIQQLIASAPENSQFHHILNAWKNTKQPIARFDFFLLCKQFQLLNAFH